MDFIKGLFERPIMRIFLFVAIDILVLCTVNAKAESFVQKQGGAATTAGSSATPGTQTGTGKDGDGTAEVQSYGLFEPGSYIDAHGLSFFFNKDGSFQGYFDETNDNVSGRYQIMATQSADGSTDTVNIILTTDYGEKKYAVIKSKVKRAKFAIVDLSSGGATHDLSYLEISGESEEEE